MQKLKDYAGSNSKRIPRQSDKDTVGGERGAVSDVDIKSWPLQNCACLYLLFVYDKSDADSVDLDVIKKIVSGMNLST